VLLALDVVLISQEGAIPDIAIAPLDEVLVPGAAGYIISDDITGAVKLMTATEAEFSAWRARRAARRKRPSTYDRSAGWVACPTPPGAGGGGGGRGRGAAPSDCCAKLGAAGWDCARSDAHGSLGAGRKFTSRVQAVQHYSWPHGAGHTHLHSHGHPQVVHSYTLNPKCIRMGELYGEYNSLTNEWTDGLGSSLIRAAVADTAPDR